MQIAHLTAELLDDGTTVLVTGRVNLSGGSVEGGERLNYTTDLGTAKAMLSMATALGGVVL